MKINRKQRANRFDVVGRNQYPYSRFVRRLTLVHLETDPAIGNTLVDVRWVRLGLVENHPNTTRRVSAAKARSTIVRCCRQAP